MLLMITRLNKILKIKRESIKKLNDLNGEAERTKALGEPFSKDFQMSYALLVLDLEKLNKDLSDYLIGVQRYCEEFAPEFKTRNGADEIDFVNEQQNLALNTTQLKVDDLKQHYLSESVKLVGKLNLSDNIDEPKTASLKIKSKRTVELITKLTSLLLQVRDYVNSTNKNMFVKGGSEELNGSSNPSRIPITTSFLPYCTRTLSETIGELKMGLLKTDNVELFEDKVQVHINHIQSTLCHYNKLHAFKYELNSESDMEKTLKLNNFENSTSQDEEEEEEDDDEEDENGEQSNGS